MLPTDERSLYVGLDPSSEGCRRHADAVNISVFEACGLVVQQLTYLPGYGEGWLGIRGRSEIGSTSASSLRRNVSSGWYHVNSAKRYGGPE